MEPERPRSAGRRPSFRGNSLARFASDIYGLVTAFIVATVTARVLGPSARGFYSTLALLIVLFVQVFNAGLGEAAVVLSGRDRFPLRTATRATAAVLLPLSVASVPIFVVAANAILQPASTNHRLAIVLGASAVFINVVSTTIVWFLVAEERISVVAALTALGSTVTVVTLCLFVAVYHLNASGAVLGTVCGLTVTLVGIGFCLRRSDLPLAPRWNGSYLKRAFRFGVAVQLSNLLVQMTGRLDLVLVYRLSGSGDAGRYSIALTIGSLVTSVPMAIAFASFPRLANLDEVDARTLTTQITRIGLTSALLSAVFLAVATPLALPIVFGSAYAAATAPTLVLLLGSILWSGQWLLARAAAAQGRPRSLFVSFVWSFGVMVALDLVLIRPFGIVGAAVAALVASAAGLIAAGSYYASGSWSLRDFLPRPTDVTYLVATVKDLARSGRKGPVLEGRHTG